MRAAGGAHTQTGDDSPPGTALCLAATTGNLAAGRDLPHTHCTTDQPGWRHGTSPWMSPATAGRQVNGAPAGEIGGYAGHLAAGALQLAAAGSAERLPACCASLRMETRRHAFEQDRDRNPLASGDSSMNVAAAAVARDSHGSASITVTDGDRTGRCTDPRAGCRSLTRHASADKLQAMVGAPDRPVLFSLPLIMAPRCAASGSLARRALRREGSSMSAAALHTQLWVDCGWPGSAAGRRDRR